GPCFGCSRERTTPLPAVVELLGPPGAPAIGGAAAGHRRARVPAEARASSPGRSGRRRGRVQAADEGVDWKMSAVVEVVRGLDYHVEHIRESWNASVENII